ncbi:MAG TPA: acyl-CoA dehydrogenase [Vicinamibacteria bacterium]
MFSWIIRQVRAAGLVPRMSETEREALRAGTVWLEGGLFAGRPDFDRLMQEAWPKLTEEERAFLEGPVEEVCALVDEWSLAQARELPPQVMDALRAHGFFGLVIPKAHGGKGFSSLGVSAILGKLASRSLGLSTIVLLPNSVGPAELLHLYGTEEQKHHYLPRLARGEEIPCFALTEPEAGSDAAALTSRGTVFRRDDGRLMLRLDFEKRYITLAPIATLIGLAVRLEDPDQLLGRGRDVGITCVLVPATAPGVEIGRRHDPMGVAFPNGPIRGQAVVVPADQIIGGPAFAGRGWAMLMEALASGRGISLPAQSTAGIKLMARAVGAYAAVRQQFGVPLGRFEGIEEPLARLAARAYLAEASRAFTCGAVDRGSKPAVVSAVMKLQQTELLRKAVADGMDVLGGAALCRGPRNLIVHGHLGAPIGITVEGANILTRTLIIYGQGAIRCHPYAQREMEALEKGDGRAFVSALLGHAGFFASNVVRAAFLGVTRGGLLPSRVEGPLFRYAKLLAWASADFAALSDLAMVTNGSRLKLRGKLTGRFADWLSQLYLAVCVLRRFEAEGRRTEDLPLARFALDECFLEMQRAREGILRHLRVPGLGLFLRGPLSIWARLNPFGTGPRDEDGASCARVLLAPSEQRDRLTEDVYLPEGNTQPLARLENALKLASAAAPILERVRQASRAGTLPKGAPETLVAAALQSGVVTPTEGRLVEDAAAARRQAIEVDSFSPEEYFGRVASLATALPSTRETRESLLTT